MSYYSFKVRSQCEVILPEWTVAIGEGIDVFCLTIQDLPKFMADLEEHGVEILEANQLDNLSPTSAELIESELQNQTEFHLLPDRV
jgi:hypothetical protein